MERVPSKCSSGRWDLRKSDSRRNSPVLRQPRQQQQHHMPSAHRVPRLYICNQLHSL